MDADKSTAIGPIAHRVRAPYHAGEAQAKASRMFRARVSILLATGLALAACASGPGADYPSLAIRDAEREFNQLAPATGDCVDDADGAADDTTGSLSPKGRLTPAEPAPAPPPPPALSDEIVERVAQLEQQARSAHADFEAALPAARSAIHNSGAVGSKAWGRAQVAYADLRSIRARTAIPLAELDALLATRAVTGEPLDGIVTVRAQVAEMLEEEDAALAELAPN